MKIINNDINEGTVITVGKFEGLHLGHISLIEAVQGYAEKNNLASALLSFIPHPVQVLKDKYYKLLYTYDEQIYILNKYHLDYWIPYPFSLQFSKMSSEDFCKLLKSKYNCKALFIGENFKFGHNREGDYEVLKKASDKLDIKIKNLKNETLGGEIISSSKIRKCIQSGNITKANEYLGSPYHIIGKVAEGKKLGSKIGFPTANIHLSGDKLLPPYGVYASKVTVLNESFYAISNIGINPTVDNKNICKAETYIFDFDKNIYGNNIIIELYDFIRGEQKFGTVEELKSQIAKDIEVVKNWIGGDLNV